MANTDNLLTLRFDTVANCTIIHLVGYLDWANCIQLRLKISDLRKSGIVNIILDLSELAYMDSTGVGVLLQARKELQNSFGFLHIACLKNEPGQIFQSLGLDSIFSAYDTVEEALKSIGN